MPKARREFLIAMSAAPVMAGCAADLTRHAQASPTELAAALGVCSASYVLLAAGRPQRTVHLSGCTAAPALPADAIYQAASLTKPVVACAALQMVLAGQLDLQAPLSHYLPRGYTHFRSVLARKPGDASDTVAASALTAITLRTLLNHTSGLPNWSGGDLLPSFAAGERWQYSGEGYVLLQSVIEAVTGQDLETHLRDQMFAPLGMRHSSLVWRDEFAAHVQTGTSAAGARRQVRFDSPVAAASLYTTAADYARFIAAFIASEPLRALCVSMPVMVDRRLGVEWGLGWGIERAERGINLWQWGNNPGYRSFAMVSPASGDGFVLLSNHDRGMALAVPLAQAVLPMAHNAFRFPLVG